jgi:hypothetical protein
MRLIIDALWVPTCVAAWVFTAPLELLVYYWFLLLSWTETRRSFGTGRGGPALSP